MKILSKEETASWCRQHNIALNDRDLPETFDCHERFKIPVDSQQRVHLVFEGMRVLANEPSILVWFDDWSVWPSGQRMHVFDQFRKAYGETRLLIHSPGHVFEPSEIEDAISFVTLGVLFLWDCYVVTPRRDKLLFFSHDEFGLTKAFTWIWADRHSVPQPRHTDGPSEWLGQLCGRAL
jgi:hypothetical protein